MATRAKTICRHPGCGALIDNPGYCDKHKKLTVGWHRSNKSTSASRGYGASWRKLRDEVFHRDKGLCQVCLKAGRIRAGTDVDHIVPKSEGGTDDISNLQLLCSDDHKAKTIAERGRQGRDPTGGGGK